MNRQQHLFMKVLQKIRVFDGLVIHEAQTLVASSYMKQFAKGETVYQKGGSSDDMLVLILGCLKVLGEDGHALVDIPSSFSVSVSGGIA